MLVKPTTPKELETAIGVIIYIARYIYKFSLFNYHLIQLQKSQSKSKTLKWTPEANIAWKIIMHLIKNAPILHTPTVK